MLITPASVAAHIAYLKEVRLSRPDATCRDKTRPMSTSNLATASREMRHRQAPTRRDLSRLSSREKP